MELPNSEYSTDNTQCEVSLLPIVFTENIEIKNQIKPKEGELLTDYIFRLKEDENSDDLNFYFTNILNQGKIDQYEEQRDGDLNSGYLEKRNYLCIKMFYESENNLGLKSILKLLFETYEFKLKNKKLIAFAEKQLREINIAEEVINITSNQKKTLH